MNNKPRLLATFLSLIKIDGISRLERQVADYLIGYFRKLGISVTEDNAAGKIDGNAGNLYLKLPGNVSGKSLLFIAHLDTISSTADLKTVVTKDRVCSDGQTILGADNRAGVCLLCELVRYLKENSIEHGPLEIVFSVAEEIGLYGAKNFDYAKIESKTAFVLDACDRTGVIVTRAPGRDNIAVNIQGKSAHAGVDPEKGINAIAIAARAINNIKQGRVDNETTLNIGKIRGGQATNIVPEHVVLEGEIRSFRKNKLNRQREKISQKFQQAASEFGGRVDFRHEISFESYNLRKNAQPVILAVKAAETVGLNFKITQSGGGSDANVLNKQRIASVGLGVGAGNAHSTEEYLSLPDFYQAFDWLLEIVKFAKKH